MVGKVGNPLAAGAKVTVNLDDGSHRSQEVTSGSGYLSQSATLMNIGFPDSAKVVDVQVQWPDGTTKKYDTVDVGKTVVIRQ